MIVTTFPRKVRVIEHMLIPLKDGTTLAARIWLPEDAERNPVPAILEYLPYRKRDGTYERDALTHPYLAGHGYAGVRVDIRGSGESRGLLFDEYAPQEQDDGVELIAWLAAQPWCSGAVGMMGISLGRLQWASDRGAPPAGAQGDRDHLLDRRSLRRRCPLHGRHASHGRTRMGLVLLRLDVPPARPGPRRRQLARDVAGAAGEHSAVLRAVAGAPAARRLLEAWIGLRGLRGDPMPGLRRRRLDRCL